MKTPTHLAAYQGGYYKVYFDPVVNRFRNIEDNVVIYCMDRLTPLTSQGYDDSTALEHRVTDLEKTLAEIEIVNKEMCERFDGTKVTLDFLNSEHHEQLNAHKSLKKRVEDLEVENQNKSIYSSITTYKFSTVYSNSAIAGTLCDSIGDMKKLRPSTRKVAGHLKYTFVADKIETVEFIYE